MVLGEFGDNYARGKPTEEHRNNSVSRKKIICRQLKNDIINSVVDETLLNLTQKVSATREALIVLDSDYDENNLYQAEKIFLNRLKKNLNGVSVRLNANLNIHMGL